VAIAVRAASQVGGIGSSVAFPALAGVQIGDKLYGWILHDASVQYVLPTGWSTVASDFAGSGTIRFIEYSGSNPTGSLGSVSFTDGGGAPLSNHYAIGLVALQRDPAHPTYQFGVDAQAFEATASSTGPAVCPSVTPAQADDLLIAVAGWGKATTFSAPGGWTEQIDVRSGDTTTDRSLWVGVKQLAGGAGSPQAGPSVTNDNPFASSAGVFKVGQVAISLVAPAPEWVGDFSTGLSQFPIVSQADPVAAGVGSTRIVVQSDTPPSGFANYASLTVYDVDVYPLTPTENPRAQLQSPRILYPGMDKWLSWKTRFPADFPPISRDPALGLFDPAQPWLDGTWLLFAQINGPPFGPPNWAMYTYGNDIVMRQRGVDGTGTVVANRASWRTRLIRGVWLDFCVRIRFAQDFTGFVELWYQGRRQLLVDPANPLPQRYRTVYPTINPDENAGNDFHLTHYRGAGEFAGPVTIHHAAGRISDTPPPGLDFGAPVQMGERARLT